MAAINTARLVNTGARGGIIGASIATLAIIGFNYTRSPDKQSVEGISNTTLMTVAIAAVVFAWLTSRR